MAVCLSHSGATAEVLAAADLLRDRGLTLLAITSDRPSPLAALAQGRTLSYALPAASGEPFGGAPTCSVVAMEALANALAVEVAVRHRRFSRPLFKRNHPGGALGKLP